MSNIISFYLENKALMNGIILLIFGAFFKIPQKIYNYLKRKIVWKKVIKAKKLKSKVFLISNYNEIFCETNSYKTARDKFLLENRNLIIYGRCGVGTTRTAYEILSKLKDEYIIFPNSVRPPEFDENKSFKTYKNKKFVLFIDDINKFAKADIDFYINRLNSHKNFRFIATCEIGNNQIFDQYDVQDLETFKLDDWTIEEGRIFSQKLNQKFFNENSFNSTPDSVLNNFEKIKRNYNEIKNDDIKNKILYSLKFQKILIPDSIITTKTTYEIFQDYFEGKSDIYNFEEKIKRLAEGGFYTYNKGVISNISDAILRIINYDPKESIELIKKYDQNKLLLNLAIREGAQEQESIYKEIINTTNEDSFEFAEAKFRLGNSFVEKAIKEKDSLNIEQSQKMILIAIENFEKALEKNGENTAYLLGLGFAYSKASSIFQLLEKEDVAKEASYNALNYYKRIEKKNNDNVSVKNMIAFTYFQLGDNIQAEKYANEALDINPNYSHSYNVLGKIYQNREGESEKAINFYERFLTLNNSHFQTYNNLGYIYLQKLQKSTDKDIKDEYFDKAKDNFEKALYYSKESFVVSFCNLGHLYNNIGDYDNAKKVLDKAIEKSPKYTEAYIARGYTLISIKEYNLAEKDLRKSIVQNPLSNNAKSNLAYCLSQKGKIEKKKKNFEKSNEYFNESIYLYDEIINNYDNDEQLKLNAELGKAIALEQNSKKEDAFEIFENILFKNIENEKVFNTFLTHLDKSYQIDQIINTFSLLIKVLISRQKPITKRIMEISTTHISNLAKQKYFSDELEEFIGLLKDDYIEDTKKYYIFKTSGKYYLHKALQEIDPEKKLEMLKLSENDFNKGFENYEKKVFEKYIAVVKAKRCFILKEINQNEYYKEVKITKDFFNKLTKKHPNYAELFIEKAIFLYTNGENNEAKKSEEIGIEILNKRKEKGDKNQFMIDDDLKELNQLKQDMGIV